MSLAGRGCGATFCARWNGLSFSSFLAFLGWLEIVFSYKIFLPIVVTDVDRLTSSMHLLYGLA